MSKALYCTACESNVTPRTGSRGWAYACDCDPQLTAPLPYDGDPRTAHTEWTYVPTGRSAAEVADEG